MKPQLKKTLNGLDFEELVETEILIQELIGDKKQEMKSSLRKKWIAEAEVSGMSIDDILWEPEEQKKIEPKYQNPNNPAKTWSGRGRKPTWIIEYLESQNWSVDDAEAKEQAKTLLETILIDLEG